MTDIGRVIRAATLCWLAAWYAKVFFFVRYLGSHIQTFPVKHEMFPDLWMNPHAAAFAYYLPAAALPVVLFPGKKRCVFASFLLAVSSFFLMNHIDTYNDATFVTSFWVAVWLMWLSLNCDTPAGEDGGVRFHARVLALCMVSMIFLGGLAGKLTPEYFRGDAFYHIFFRPGAPWPHAWLMAALSLEQLHRCAFYFSWGVILLELFLALSPLLPFRIALTLGPAALLCMTLTNTWAILSVVGSLIGMLLSCRLLSDTSKNGSPMGS